MKISKKDKKEKEASPILIFEEIPAEPPLKLRALNLFGEVDTEKSNEVCASLLVLRETGKREIREDPEDFQSEIVRVEYQPIDLNISTYGGEALSMFAIYDTMRIVREDCDINTLGLGKVMSAGVILLAAGTKGQRQIGANCRVMIHAVMGGDYGPIHSLENEVEEVRWIQEQYSKALLEETNMTKRELKKLFDRKVNVYLTAHEALEYGIVDEIV
jgi:ATP-dependent Clp endopeptidase proteolytic subunit ClpP